METQSDGIEVKAEMLDYRSYIFERSRRKIPTCFSRQAKIRFGHRASDFVHRYHVLWKLHREI